MIVSNNRQVIINTVVYVKRAFNFEGNVERKLYPDVSALVRLS